MTSEPKLYFFTCSVSEDLYGASLSSDGTPLPTPSGGKWLPVEYPAGLKAAAATFDEAAARREIEQWGCHWFTSKGPREIYWGPAGAPKAAVNS